MSSLRTLLPGSSTVFTTRVIGYPTLIEAIPLPNSQVPTSFTWHRELCHQPVIEVNGVGRVGTWVYGDGALVTVRNVNRTGNIQVMTDYL